jgi:hypothetical protein
LEPGGRGSWEVTFQSPSFSDRLKTQLRTDYRTILDNPHPNARADTVFKYLYALTTSGSGCAKLNYLAIKYPKISTSIILAAEGALIPGPPSTDEGVYGAVGAWTLDRLSQTGYGDDCQCVDENLAP